MSALIADFNSIATPRREQLELALKALAQEEAEATQLGVSKPDESTRTHSDQFSHQERRPWTKKSQVDRQILWDPAAGELTEVRFDHGCRLLSPGPPSLPSDSVLSVASSSSCAAYS